MAKTDWTRAPLEREVRGDKGISDISFGCDWGAGAGGRMGSTAKRSQFSRTAGKGDPRTPSEGTAAEDAGCISELWEITKRTQFRAPGDRLPFPVGPGGEGRQSG